MKKLFLFIFSALCVLGVQAQSANGGITPEMLGQSSNPVLEEGEDLYMMVGDFTDDPRNPDNADHRLVADGYISVVAHNLDCTDYEQTERLRQMF